MYWFPKHLPEFFYGFTCDVILIFSFWDLTDDLFIMLWVTIILNKCLMLIEFFADISTYGILNESANSYKKQLIRILLHMTYFGLTSLSDVKSHLFLINRFFISLLAYWSMSCNHLWILFLNTNSSMLINK